jgi:hypothetical protein
VTNFKTVVGRISYSIDFDKLLLKERDKILEAGNVVVDQKFCLSDNFIVCVVEYKKKSSKNK